MASLLGSEATPSSGSEDEPPPPLLEENKAERVAVRRTRVKQEAGENGYFVLNKGRRMGRQAERMPMLHSTLTQTPTETDVQLMSE